MLRLYTTCQFAHFLPFITFLFSSLLFSISLRQHHGCNAPILAGSLARDYFHLPTASAPPARPPVDLDDQYSDYWCGRCYDPSHVPGKSTLKFSVKVSGLSVKIFIYQCTYFATLNIILK